MSAPADEVPAIVELRRFREMLVDERRRLVGLAVNAPSGRSGAASFGADIALVQSNIEAVDRAIQDEGRLRQT